MTEQITIQGQTFNVEPRYTEGYTLKANEAGALNQTYFENLRNNFAKQVKDGMEANVGLDVLQSKLDAYAAEYEFGVRTGGGGGRSGDPVLSEAMSIARDRVRAAIKSKGRKLSDYSAEQITTGARKLLDTQGADGEIMQAARQRVEAEKQAAQSAAAELAEIIDAMPTEPTEPATPEATAEQTPAAAA